MAQNRVTSVAAEVLRTGGAKARITSVAAEALVVGNAKGRVTAVALEVLRSTADGAVDAWASVEAPDVFNAIGGVNVFGTFDTTEAKDAMAVIGGVPDTGVWLDTEAPDHFFAYVVTPPIGTFDTTEAPDTFTTTPQPRFGVERVIQGGSSFTLNTGGPDRVLLLFYSSFGSGAIPDHVTGITDDTGLEWHCQDYAMAKPTESGEVIHTEMWWAYARDQIVNSTAHITTGGGFSFTHNLNAVVVVKGMGGNFGNPFADLNPFSYGSNTGAFITPPNTQVQAPSPIATGDLSPSGTLIGLITLDPASAQGVTLDGTNLEVTGTGASPPSGPHNYATIKFADARRNGRIYFEVEFTKIAGTHYGVGMAFDTDSAQQITSCIDNGVGGTFVRGDGTIWIDGVQVGTIGAIPADGDIIGIGIDFDNSVMWAADVTQHSSYNNNPVSALPVYSSTHFSAGGLSYIPGDTPPDSGGGIGNHVGSASALVPFVSTDHTSNLAKIIVNFGADPFVGTAPAGFQAGWGTIIPAATPVRSEQHAMVFGWDVAAPDDGLVQTPPGFDLVFGDTGDISAAHRLTIYAKTIAQNILVTDNDVMVQPTATKHWLMAYDTLVAGHVSPGTLESTEAKDTFRGVGFGPGGAGVFGNLAGKEIADAMHFVGAGPNVGVLLGREAQDTFSMFISVPLIASFNVTEATDKFVATGLGRGEDGTWFSTEALDTLTINGVVPITGTFDTSETADRFRAIGSGVVTSRRRRRRNFVT